MQEKAIKQFQNLLFRSLKFVNFPDHLIHIFIYQNLAGVLDFSGKGSSLPVDIKTEKGSAYHKITSVSVLYMDPPTNSSYLILILVCSGFFLWRLMPLSTIFQLYRGGCMYVFQCDNPIFRRIRTSWNTKLLKINLSMQYC